MSWIDNLWSGRFRGRESTNGSIGTMTLDEFMKDYDLVELNEEPGQQFAIVTPREQSGQQMADTVAPFEIGTTSPSPWTSFLRQEYNPKLQGIRGLEAYDKMRRSDGTVRGTMRALKTPVLSGRWFIQPGGTKKVDKKAGKFIHKVLFDDQMSISWTQVLTEALLMLDFGYYMFELVWDNRMVDGQLRTVLTKLAPRHPMDVKEWVFDAHGGPVGVWFYSNSSDIIGDSKFIPIEKLLVFSFDREAGNIEGMSVLRSAYKHWYFKEQLYKIDAIQKERHGIGIPVIKLPLGYKPEDKKIAEDLGRNIRTNERAHIVLPPGWEISMLKLEGQLTDAMDSIEHHDSAIRENILVNFIRDGAREEDLVMFFKASRLVADIVADTFNCYLIPKLIAYNFQRAAVPKLRVRRIGEAADWRTLSFAIRNLIGAGVIIPDEPLEVNLREEMDLPEIDYDTARLIATPQNPYDMNDETGGDGSGDGAPASSAAGEDTTGSNTHNTNNPSYNRNQRGRGRKKPSGARVGLPRQTVTRNVRNSYGLPSGNAGNDTSGGK